MLKMVLEILGNFLQLVGVLIILIVQVWFLYEARRKYGSSIRALYDVVATRFGMSKEKLKETSNEYILKTFPHVKFLHDDIMYSLVGLVVTLFGLLFSLTSSFL